jgi:hypothetical protein
VPKKKRSAEVALLSVEGQRQEASGEGARQSGQRTGPPRHDSTGFNADAEALYPWLRGNGLTRLGGASPLDCPLLGDNAQFHLPARHDFNIVCGRRLSAREVKK